MAGGQNQLAYMWNDYYVTVTVCIQVHSLTHALTH